MTDPHAPKPGSEGSPLSEWLAQRSPRPVPDEPLQFAGGARSVLIERPEELAALAIGALILQKAAEHEGTRLPSWLVHQLRERLTQPFTSREVMNMEVEAYDILCWVAGLHAEPSAPAGAAPDRDLIAYDPEMPVIDLLRRAIAEEFEVEIQYYTQSRGELTRRRITPNHIQAETYLHAYCHERREERIFRISRIAEIRPIDGKPVSLREAQRKPAQGRLAL